MEQGTVPRFILSALINIGKIFMATENDRMGGTGILFENAENTLRVIENLSL